MITGWLTGKMSGIIIFIIACLSIPLAIAASVQTVRLNGISVFGWYAVKGYKPMWEADEKDLVTLRANNGALSHGLDTCNASVTALGDAGKKLTDAAQVLIDQAKGLQSQTKINVAAINAIKSAPEKCPVAEAILSAGFQ